MGRVIVRKGALIELLIVGIDIHVLHYVFINLS